MGESVNIREAAELAKVNPKTLRRYVERGKLKGSLRRGRRGIEYCFDADDIRALEIGRRWRPEEQAEPAPTMDDLAAGIRTLGEKQDEMIAALVALREALGELTWKQAWLNAQIGVDSRQRSIWERAKAARLRRDG